MKKEIIITKGKSDEVIADFIAENVEEKVILKDGYNVIIRDITCENCKNYLENGICTGNSKNENIDTTGELKCFE